MKFLILFIFMLSLTVQLWAHPAADKAPASAANGTKAAEAAVSKITNPLTAHNATDVLSKLPKGGQGLLNPADILKHGTEFISAVTTACENLIKSLLKLCSPTSLVAGELSKLPSILKPTDVANMTKNVMDDVLKMFKLPLSTLPGTNDAAKHASNATDSLKNTPKDALNTAGAEASGKNLVADAAKVGSSVIGDSLKLFGK